MANRTPATVYHYTNGAGLHGILKSKALWATDAAFLNDSKEISYAQQHFIDALESRAEELAGTERPLKGGPNYNRGAQMRSAAAALRHLADQADPWFVGRIYLICFCAKPDSLSQWRSYGAGGYAIGFATEDLQSLPVRPADQGAVVPPPQPELAQVNYRLEDVHALADALAPQPTGHPGARGAAEAESGCGARLLARLKDPAFEDEAEWRLIVEQNWIDWSLPLSMEFMIREPAGFVPYYPLPIEASVIRNVRVGPGPYEELRALSTRRLLAKYGIDAAVLRSSAPYRP